MDRRFNRASYLAEQVTADFAKQVRESVDQDTIGGALLELARTPLQPATAGLCPVGSAEPNTGYEP